MSVGRKLLRLIKAPKMDVYVVRVILIFVKERGAACPTKAALYHGGGIEVGRNAVNDLESVSPEARKNRHGTSAALSAVTAVTIFDHDRRTANLVTNRVTKTPTEVQFIFSHIGIPSSAQNRVKRYLAQYILSLIFRRPQLAEE